MSGKFVEIKPEEVNDNVFRLVGTDWMLVTAGTLNSWNTMTASWGAFGNLWMKNIAICFIRPSRRTYEFLESAKFFTLSFFDRKYRSILDYCGSHSGRDVDKAKETGLIPVSLMEGTVHFEQARLVFICRKIYHQDIDSSRFIDPEIFSFYPEGDYHRMYLGELVKVFKKS